MKGGNSTVIRRPTTEKSNVELVNALRSNFQAARQLEAPTNGSSNNGSTGNSHSSNGSSSDYKTWTSQHDGGGTLYVPAHDFSQSGLSEERAQYDITVKLFYLPGIPVSRRCAHTREAIDLVLKELGADSIDLLIVSFPGVLFDAEDDSDDDDGVDEEEGEGKRSQEVDAAGNDASEDDFESMVQTWQTLEKIKNEGRIAQLGVAEFGCDRLARLLARTNVKPSVDQINLKDCCVVPKSLIIYAKQQGIQLLTHNDCHDILPVGTTRELLGPGEQGAGILASTPDGNDGIPGHVEPQWVVKYTAVVRDRGVVENKGYFALADIGTCVQPEEEA